MAVPGTLPVITAVIKIVPITEAACCIFKCYTFKPVCLCCFCSIMDMHQHTLSSGPAIINA